MSGPETAPPLGLVAGAGRLPLAAARALRAADRRVVAVGFEGLTATELESAVDAMRWLRLGQLEAMAEAFREQGVVRLLLVGKVPKTLLFDGGGVVEPDPEALALIGALRDRGDEALLRALADWLGDRGFDLCAQDGALPSLRMPSGPLTRATPDQQALEDLSLGWPVLCALGRAGVGQCVVLNQGAVLALEAIEGTDETIRRAGRLGGPGATVIKAARPDQDRRFDLPVAGPETIAALVEIRARALALEAGRVLLVDGDEMIAAADRAGIAIWGFTTLDGEA
jgi:DUF1009 family protein